MWHILIPAATNTQPQSGDEANAEGIQSKRCRNNRHESAGGRLTMGLHGVPWPVVKVSDLGCRQHTHAISNRRTRPPSCTITAFSGLKSAPAPAPKTGAARNWRTDSRLVAHPRPNKIPSSQRTGAPAGSAFSRNIEARGQPLRDAEDSTDSACWQRPGRLASTDHVR